MGVKTISRIVILALLVDLLVGCSPSAPLETSTLPDWTPYRTPVSQAAFRWAGNYGGDGHDQFDSVAPTPDGGAVAVGRSGFHKSKKVDFPASPDKEDAIIARFSPHGTLEWSKVLSGSCPAKFIAVSVTPSGDIIAIVHTTKLDGFFLPASAGRAGEVDVIVKLDSAGAVIWMRSYEQMSFKSVSLAPDDSIVVTGVKFSNTTTENLALVAKLSTEGDIIWSQTYNADYRDRFVSAVVTRDGDVVAAGYVEHVGQSDDFRDALAVCFDATGSPKWVKTFGGSRWDEFTGVVASPEGNIVFAGYANSTDGDFVAISENGTAVLVKLSPDGTVLWANMYAGEGYTKFLGVAVADNGNIVAAGCTFPTDKDTPQHAMIAQIDPVGNLVAVGILDGSGNRFNSVTIAAGGDIVAVGLTWSNTGQLVVKKGKWYDAMIAAFPQLGITRR